MSPPYPVIRARLDHAIANRDLAAVRSAARARLSVVTLGDAVQVLVLMLEVDDPTFEAAAVRWIARFTGECAGVTLGETNAFGDCESPCCEIVTSTGSPRPQSLSSTRGH